MAKPKPNFKSYSPKKSGKPKSDEPRESKKQTSKTHGDGIKSDRRP